MFLDILEGTAESEGGSERTTGRLPAEADGRARDAVRAKRRGTGRVCA